MAAAVLLPSAASVGAVWVVPLGTLSAAVVSTPASLAVALRAVFLAKAASASTASTPSGPWGTFDGDDDAAVVGFCGAELAGGDFGARGAVPGVEDWEVWPSGGRTAPFWPGGAGTGDATGGEVGEAGVSLGSSSKAANGLVWSVASADVELLRGPWPRWAWRAALASDTTDTSHLLKGLPARLCAIPNAILVPTHLCNRRAIPPEEGNR